MAEHKPGPRHRALPALYGAIYPTLVDVGMENGYAMALHGSLARDMDVIAVPWTESPSDDGMLAEAVARALGAVAGDDIVVVPPDRGGAKLHGRRVWTIVLDGGAFIDLSVMPRSEAATDGPEDEKAEIYRQGWAAGHSHGMADEQPTTEAREQGEEIEWFDVVRPYIGRTWCATCESYDHECGCVPDIHARYANRLANEIRDRLASPAPSGEGELRDELVTAWEAMREALEEISNMGCENWLGQTLTCRCNPCIARRALGLEPIGG